MNNFSLIQTILKKVVLWAVLIVMIVMATYLVMLFHLLKFFLL